MSGPYALFATAKLKLTVEGSAIRADGKTHGQNICDAAEHELRLKPILNANSALWARNRVLLPGGIDLNFQEFNRQGLMSKDFFLGLVKPALQSHGLSIIQVAKNAVLAQQVQFTASPEYFTRTQAGAVVLDDKYQDWRSCAVEFMQTRFGEHLLCAVEHLDELTPHITGVVIPLIMKSVKVGGRGSKSKLAGKPQWRLTAYDVFNRTTLRKIWDDYGQAATKIGLLRPPPESRVSSESVQHHYGAIKRGEENAVAILAKFKIELPSVAQTFLPESAKDYKQRIDQTLQLEMERIKDLIRDLTQQAANNTQLRRKEKELRTALERKEAALVKMKQERNDADMKNAELSARTRDISYADVLRKLGVQVTLDATKAAFLATLPDGRPSKSYDGRLFEIAGAPPIKGKGSIELIAKVQSITIEEAEKVCVRLFGIRAIGAAHARMRDKFESAMAAGQAEPPPQKSKPTKIVIPCLKPTNVVERDRHRQHPPDRNDL